MMIENLDIALQSDQYADQYFLLLQEFLAQSKVQVLEEEKDQRRILKILSVMFSKIDEILSDLLHLQDKKSSLGIDGLTIDLNLGCGLNRLLDIINQLLTVDFIREEFKKGGGYLRNTIKAFLKTRKLLAIKNKVLRQCEKQIENIFTSIHADSEGEKLAFLTECIHVLAIAESDELHFLYETICKQILPEKPMPNYLVNLQKAHT
jgi:hypothetical protein